MSQHKRNSVHPSTCTKATDETRQQRLPFKKVDKSRSVKITPNSKYPEKDKTAALLIQLFKGRTNDLLVGDASTMRHERLNSPLCVEQIIDDHLAQQRCLGVYPVRDDASVFFSAADFDDKPTRPDPASREKAAAAVAQLKKLGLHPLVEVSTSGRGVHVWLFYGEPVAAWIARRCWFHVFESIRISPPEIFPRQDYLDPGKIGNGIRLPLFGRSHFVDVEDDWRMIPPLSALTSVRRIKLDAIHAAAKTLGCDLSKPPEQKQTKRATPRERCELPPCVAQLIAADSESLLARRWRGETEELRDRSRSAIAFSIAILLIRAYVPTTEIEDALLTWCRSVGYEKGSKRDWITLTIQNAYDQLCSDYLQQLRRRRELNLRVGLPLSIRRAHSAAVAKRRRS